MPRDSASTITAVTASPDFHGQGTIPAAPSVEQLIADIYQSFSEDKIHAGPGYEITARDRQLHRQRTQQRRADFDRILSAIPEGFELAPVFCTHTDPNQRLRLQMEYFTNVRGAFLRFLAENHADELRALGISERGIRRMWDKQDPTDDKGRYYALNIDHVIEQATSGSWAASKRPDPLRHPDVGPKYPVNHFGNLVLLPEYIHALKNRLNIIQRTSFIEFDGPKWVLALVPVRDGTRSALVAAPQNIKSLPLRPAFASDKTSEAKEVLTKTIRMIDDAQRAHAQIRAFTAFCAALPQRGGDHDSDHGDDHGGARVEKLRFAFNALIEPGSAPHRFAHRQLLPRVNKTVRAVEAAMAAVISGEESRKSATVKSFRAFYQSKKMQRLRNTIACLPFNEAAAALPVFERIDRFLSDFHQQLVRRGDVAAGKSPGAAGQKKLKKQ